MRKQDPSGGRIAALTRQVLLAAGIWLLLTGPLAAAESPDLPTCEAQAGSSQPALSLGVVQPYASPELLDYAVKLARSSEKVELCSESWREVTPRLVPWAGRLERGYGFALFVLALIVVAAVLSAVVPRRYWRGTTLTGVLVVGGLTWLVGVGALALFHFFGGQRLVYGTVVSLRPAGQPVAEWLDLAGARELETALSQRGLPASLLETAKDFKAVVVAPVPGGQYRVFHRLNLREQPGVAAARFTVLPTGQPVRFDGATQGDWWRVRTENGRTGWVSSIWLRRPEEK